MASSAVETVYNFLVDNILSGEYPAGARLDRRKIADELGVSYSPVCEAVLQLELEGLLATRPRKGTFVLAMDDAYLQDQLIARMAIECQAARIYCGQRISEHKVRLLELAEDIESAPAGTLGRAVKDTKFHRELVKLADSPTLLQMYDMIMRKGLFLAAYAQRGSDKGLGVDIDHCQLLDLLERNEPDLAEFVMRTNIMHGKSLNGDVSKSLEKENTVVGQSPARERLLNNMDDILENCNA